MPNQIDVFVQGFPITEGAQKLRFPDSTLEGIFELTRHPSDPTKDRLRWCFSMPTKDRPKEFSAAKGTNQKLICLVRFDESKALASIRETGGRTLQHSEGWTKSVVLDDPSIESVNAINKLKRLKSLTLGKANEQLLEQIGSHPSLSSLTFRCEVSKEVLESLASTLPQLKRLEFVCDEFSSDFGRLINEATSLETLKLSVKGTNYDGLALINDSPVKTLHFFASKISLFDIAKVGGSLPAVRDLKLYGCEILSNKIAEVDSLRQIESVVISNCRIDETSRSKLDKLPNVKEFKVSGRFRLPDSTSGGGFSGAFSPGDGRF